MEVLDKSVAFVCGRICRASMMGGMAGEFKFVLNGAHLAGVCACRLSSDPGC